MNEGSEGTSEVAANGTLPTANVPPLTRAKSKPKKGENWRCIVQSLTNI